ncbi:hypothetical protein V1512DRAFT_263464 [Lipomyces arxii]|uniref:uncharacterized protein n=1 Tax=Lipomyces arxii TaxID=56418 RepID=UPI0034CD3B9B
MADEEEAVRQEKLAAARKRFEELKKDKKPTKKKGGKKGAKVDQDAKTGTDTPDRVDSPAPETAESSSVVARDTETPPPEDEPVAVTEDVDDAAGAVGFDEPEEESKPEQSEPAQESLPEPKVSDLNARLQALEVENAALKDSLATANAKILVDAGTIASLQAQISVPKPPSSPSEQEDYYKKLQEKFSREAQERYLLERDYASLERTHEKLVAAHNVLLAEIEKLKNQFGADEKRRQMAADADELPGTDEKQLQAARERANINARISAGTSSLFRTAQGLSAAVVKGVTGGASAVISDAPGLARKVSSGTTRTRRRAESSASYADVDLYANDEVPEDEEGEDDEAAYLRGVAKARQVAAEQQESQDAEANARAEELKEEMKKWKGYQLDLVSTGGSPGGIGPIFAV